MMDFIVLGIILILAGSAIAYIIKEKKKGVRCIGCPAAGSCSHNNSNNTSCSCTQISKDELQEISNNIKKQK